VWEVREVRDKKTLPFTSRAQSVTRSKHFWALMILFDKKKPKNTNFLKHFLFYLKKSVIFAARLF